MRMGLGRKPLRVALRLADATKGEAGDSETSCSTALAEIDDALLRNRLLRLMRRQQRRGALLGELGGPEGLAGAGARVLMMARSERAVPVLSKAGTSRGRTSWRRNEPKRTGSIMASRSDRPHVENGTLGSCSPLQSARETFGLKHCKARAM